MTAILFYNNAATSTSSFPNFCYNADFILKSPISPPTSKVKWSAPKDSNAYSGTGGGTRVDIGFPGSPGS